ncbi:hypothetical protein CIPAW_01G284300 [Carya illinoinensis]|uniref:Uncharacterized protein n=1 Tax=Carya illinoinensis TaxID=32201 RepID=A0A8T1RUN4_CARIL|nr:hypothetical protein CIPAW_01G284300 [Carya illinoinensis]
MMLFGNGGTALNITAVVLEMFLSNWFIDISTYQSSNICYIKSLMLDVSSAVDVQRNHWRLSGNLWKSTCTESDFLRALLFLSMLKATFIFYFYLIAHPEVMSQVCYILEVDHLSPDPVFSSG